MSDDDTKFKHLDYIQAAISRFNQCSFQLKGWNVTLVSAVLVIGSRKADPKFALIACIPAVVFWILDGFFLDQEKRYRQLYALVAADSDKVAPLDMNTKNVKCITGCWMDAMCSQSLAAFHGVVLVSALLVTLALMFTGGGGAVE